MLFYGEPRVGAASAAPTAPHATAAEGSDESGPARFWRPRRRRLPWGLALVASLFVHALGGPWQFLPEPSGIELKDTEGELTIPVDLLGEDLSPPPALAASPPPSGSGENVGATSSRADASAPRVDAGAGEGGLLRDSGASLTPPKKHGSDAGLDGGFDGGLVAVGDGGVADGAAATAVAAAPRDPGSLIGLGGLVSAGPVNVTMLVNVAVIRSHPAGARMGPLLTGIPQWNDFMRGTEVGTTALDPVRDTDWILIYGPSLIHTERDAVIVRYSASDDVVDRAVDAIARRSERGGPFDAGVAGVKAALGQADNGKRAFLRVQPHVLVVVPPDKAREFALALRRAPIAPRVRPGEAFRLTMKDPSKQAKVPGLVLSESLREIRLWIVPRALDRGADLFAEGDCVNADSAVDVAETMNDLIRRQNSILVRAATRGLLNNARIVPDGDAVKMHIDVSSEQLEAVLQAAGALLGVAIAPP